MRFIRIGFFFIFGGIFACLKRQLFSIKSVVFSLDKMIFVSYIENKSIYFVIYFLNLLFIKNLTNCWLDKRYQLGIRFAKVPVSKIDVFNQTCVNLTLIIRMSKTSLFEH